MSLTSVHVARAQALGHRVPAVPADSHPLIGGGGNEERQDREALHRCQGGQVQVRRSIREGAIFIPGVQSLTPNTESYT